MTLPAPPSMVADPAQCLDLLFRLTRRLTDDFNTLIVYEALRPGELGDYDEATRTLRIRPDANLPKLVQLMQQVFNLVAIGPHASVGARPQTRLSLVPAPRQPLG